MPRKANIPLLFACSLCIFINPNRLSPQINDPDPFARLSFTNITDSLHNTGIGSHGIFFADLTANNRPDLYITRLWTNPLTDLLYINTPWNNILKEEGQLRGAADLDGGTHGACFADLDNDGDFDIINGSTHAMGRNGPDHNNIYINDGHGFFTDVTALTDIYNTKRETRGLVAFDLDRDGDLDIFTVTGYLGSADTFTGTNEIYLNDGQANFSKADYPILENTKAGQGVTDVDFDSDGDIDLIVANRTGNLIIFRNDNFGKFTLIPPETIMDIPLRAGDGITMGDIDNDGDLDMLLVSEGPPSIAHLYKNNGTGYFTLKKTWNDVEGYMGGFGDLDNDGDLDLIFAGRPSALLNNGLGDFTAGPSLNYSGIRDPRAIAFADLDNDGDIDLAIADRDTCSFLIQNNLNSTNNWLKIQLISPQGQIGAFGTKTSIYPPFQPDAPLLGFRESRSSSGYLAQNDPLLHFGLGGYSTVDIKVEFPDGTLALRQNVSGNQTITIDGADVLFRLKLFLQGPFCRQTESMDPKLAPLQLIPLKSPYFQDPVQVNYIPFAAVDWILVEFSKSANGPILAAKSALLYSNGKIKDACGRELIPLTLPAGNYFITVSHRNHLKATSSKSVSLRADIATSYDFTTGKDKYLHQSGCIEIKPGITGFAAGNADIDSSIFASDLALILQAIQQKLSGYIQADINLDGKINQSDYEAARDNLLLGLHQ